MRVFYDWSRSVSLCCGAPRSLRRVERFRGQGLVISCESGAAALTKLCGHAHGIHSIAYCEMAPGHDLTATPHHGRAPNAPTYWRTWDDEGHAVKVIALDPLIDAKPLLDYMDARGIPRTGHFFDNLRHRCDSEGRIRFFQAELFCSQIGVPMRMVFGDVYFDTPIQVIVRKE